MYCDEWDLLFILGGRKLPVFEIVRHDFRKLAEKNETHQDERIASFNFVGYFSWHKDTLLAPIHQPYPWHYHPVWNCILEVLVGEHKFCSPASLPSCPGPGWPLLGLWSHLLLLSLMRLQFLQQIIVQPPWSPQLCSGLWGYHGECDTVIATPEEEISKIQWGGGTTVGALWRGYWQPTTEHSWDSEACAQRWKSRTHSLAALGPFSFLERTNISSLVGIKGGELPQWPLHTSHLRGLPSKKLLPPGSRRKGNFCLKLWSFSNQKFYNNKIVLLTLNNFCSKLY